MELNLRGRTALITGASKGIGRAAAEVLAEEGVNVIVVSRTQGDLEAVRDNIAARWNVRVEVHAFDISDSRNIDRLVAQHPDIDILVNNAGAIPAGNLQEVNEDRWREAWDLKVYGYINMCRRFYAEMKQRSRGVIINILGMAGERMDVGYIAGSTGNAGLMAFTKTLGGAASADNLRVVGINPGAIATDRLVTIMKKRAQDRLGDANRWQELMKPLPFSRAGTPEEIGWMVAFLASDKSAYTSGTIITIDGGAANRGPMFLGVTNEPARQGRCRHLGERWHRFRHRAATGEGWLPGGGRLQQPRRWCREGGGGITRQQSSHCTHAYGGHCRAA